MSRATSIITCPRCSWRAKHTADTITEVLEWLAKVLQEHVRERHVQ